MTRNMGHAPPMTTTTGQSMPQDNRLDDVWATARALVAAQCELAAALSDRDAALSAAREEGCTFPALAEAAGLNPRRVAQIVTGR